MKINPNPKKKIKAIVKIQTYENGNIIITRPDYKTWELKTRKYTPRFWSLTRLSRIISNGNYIVKSDITLFYKESK